MYRRDLFLVYFFLKTYPTFRVFRALFGKKSRRTFDVAIKRKIQYLGAQMASFLPDLWSQREKFYPPEDSDVARIFGPKCFFVVDVFPVRIRRPKDSKMQRATYHGKYRHNVLKISMAVSMSGVPLYWTSHVGAPSDSHIWNNNLPELEPDETGIADKAYQSAAHLFSAFKEYAGRPLDEYEKAFNIVLAWFRSTVEHCFSHIKNFAILGGKYRGQLKKDGGFLDHCLCIIATTVALRTLKNPLKSMESIVPGAVAAAIPREIAEEKKALLEGRGREFVEGKPIGTPFDLTVVDGAVRGIGEEPSNRGIDSGCTIADFKAGDRVLIWWWNLYWRGKVQYVAKTTNTLNVRWDYDNQVTTGYLPRLVFPLRPAAM